ncbi:MAG: B12-binding domain-containing radical SAM protein, partial [Nanoarchaeota archaeon]|nr:B12-binding domain-containing radical SAM protein [Nanoarchaeota archaeon]
MNKNEVILINPPMVNSYNPNPSLLRSEVYGEVPDVDNVLNYGLLSIATHLKKNGVKVRIIDHQLSFDFSDLKGLLKDETPLLVGISCVSAFSYLPTLDIAKYVRNIFPETIICIGGQHPSSIPKIVFEDSKETDIVAIGESEETILILVMKIKGKKEFSKIKGIAFRHVDGQIEFTDVAEEIDINKFGFLEYNLFPNFKRMFPMVEESRGCAFNCSFCSNKSFYVKCRQKDPNILIEEIKYVHKYYGGGDAIPLVLLCSNFGSDPIKTKKFLSMAKNLDFKLECLASMRVDNKWEPYIDDMGTMFRQVRFGLESASVEILERMNKSYDDRKYISLASEAFKRLKKQNIRIECNMIFGYCGESAKTLNESLRFIYSNPIDSIWASALMAFPGSPFLKDIDKLEREFNTTLVHNEFYDKIHAWPVNPSKVFSHEEMRIFCQTLPKIFNSEEAYYDYIKWISGP